ncbi:MAG: hypothetical protein KJO07_03395 [Deltaproteobacteria bacterium]|nr:hypothetical protein [Deltaproteobacteria bacterium]
MVFAESAARWLLVLHAILGVAVVAVTTHLAIWLHRYRQGRHKRVAAIRRFSRYALALYLASFVLGNVVYPSYKVGVRAEYLEDGSASTRDWADRLQARRKLIERYRTSQRLYGEAAATIEVPQVPEEPPLVARRAAKLARWFDVKEHWVAMGLALVLAVFLILRVYNPQRDPQVILPLLTWMATAAAGATWLAGIIGLMVSGYRAVGPL